MGTDINMVAQKRINGQWETVGKIFPNTHYTPRWPQQPDTFGEPLTHAPYQTRNYDVSGALSNQRNIHNITPITQPRGLPQGFHIDEMCLHHLPDGTQADLGEYGYSWLTLKELVDYKPGEAHYTGWLKADQYNALLVRGLTADDPTPSIGTFARSAGGPNVVHRISPPADNMTMGQIAELVDWAETEDRTGSDAYIIYEWSGPVPEHLLRPVIEPLKGLLDDQNRSRDYTTEEFESIRIVFGYDG